MTTVNSSQKLITGTSQKMAAELIGVDKNEPYEPLKYGLGITALNQWIAAESRHSIEIFIFSSTKSDSISGSSFYLQCNTGCNEFYNHWKKKLQRLLLWITNACN